jgi:hypothetical protein
MIKKNLCKSIIQTLFNPGYSVLDAQVLYKFFCLNNWDVIDQDVHMIYSVLDDVLNDPEHKDYYFYDYILPILYNKNGIKFAKYVNNETQRVIEILIQGFDAIKIDYYQD